MRGGILTAAEVAEILAVDPVVVQTMLAGGTAPDVFKTPQPNYPDYVKKGALMDVTDRIKADPVLGKPDYFIQPFESDRSAIQGRSAS